MGRLDPWMVRREEVEIWVLHVLYIDGRVVIGMDIRANQRSCKGNPLR